MALGILEVTGFTPAMVALDAMEKGASIHVVQAELNDFLGTVLKIEGSVDAVHAAISIGIAIGKSMHGDPRSTILNHPDPSAFQRGILSQPEFSPLLQQSVLIGPPSSSLDANPRSHNTMADPAHQALGFIETQGFTAVFEAIDAACKAANVEVVAKEKLGGGYVTVVIRGDVAAVKAAIDAGQSKVEGLGKLIAAHVIARPSAAVMKLLPA